MSKMAKLVEFKFLSPEEERGIKQSIPYSDIETGIVDVVKAINEMQGIVTLQSCQGHTTKMNDQTWHVQNPHVAVYCNQEWYTFLTGMRLPCTGDISIRYFDDNTFWICIIDENMACPFVAVVEAMRKYAYTKKIK